MPEIKDIAIRYDEILLEESDFTIPENGITLIRGVSGCGKTSLLYRLGLISSDQSFGYTAAEVSLNELSEKEKSSFRREHMSFVLQDSSLYEQYDVIGNLKLYAHINHKKYTGKQYREFLKAVHLNVPMEQSVMTLSGGERQRLAIACALCKDTELIFLDEPTAFLDEGNEKTVFRVLREIADTYHKTIVLTSHSLNAVEIADQIYEMKDRKLHEVRHYDSTETKTYRREEKKLPKKFIREYVNYFNRKYRRFETGIKLLLTLMLALLNGLMMYSEYSSKQSINGYQSLSENQLFITKSKENTTIDSELMSFHLNILPEGTKRDPYIPVKALINGIPYPAIPYYEGNDLSDDVLMHYNQEDRIYISAAVDQDLQGAFINPAKAEAVLVVTDAEGTVHHSESYSISANLKKTNHTPYIRQMNAGYVYVDCEILSAFCEEAGLLDETEYAGYTLLADSFENYEKAGDVLEAGGYGVNRFFEYIEQIHELEKISRNARILMSIAGTVLLLIMMSIVEVLYSRRRDREMMLLKLNGLNTAEMTKVIYQDMEKQCMTAMIINAVLLITGGYLLHTQSLLYMAVNAVILAVVLIGNTLLQYMHCGKMSVESVLRSMQG